jgi:protein-disulfide isomerase
MEEQIQGKKEESIQITKSTLWQVISGVLGLVLIISIFTGGFGFGSNSPTGGTIVNDPNNQGNVPTGPVDVSADDDAILGDKNADVTIIEFSDYQCPFCRKFWTETLPELKTNYINKGTV